MNNPSIYRPSPDQQPDAERRRVSKYSDCADFLDSTKRHDDNSCDLLLIFTVNRHLVESL